MQILFIASVHGSKKAQVAFTSFFQEASNGVQNSEVMERNSENTNRALELRKARLESIVKRPTKSGSKVHISEAILSKVSCLGRFGCLWFIYL